VYTLFKKCLTQNNICATDYYYLLLSLMLLCSRDGAGNTTEENQVKSKTNLYVIMHYIHTHCQLFYGSLDFVHYVASKTDAFHLLTNLTVLAALCKGM